MENFPLDNPSMDQGLLIQMSQHLSVGGFDDIIAFLMIYDAMTPYIVRRDLIELQYLVICPWKISGHIIVKENTISHAYQS